MSKIDVKVQMNLLKEAKIYFEDMQPLSKIEFKPKDSGITLTEEHIIEWLQVFYDDRIMLDTCNQATVKR